MRFIPNRRLKSVLVISSRPEYLRRAQVLLSRLDMANRATVKQVFVYPVRSRSASELAQLLQKVYNPQDQAKAAPKAPAPSPIAPPPTLTASPIPASAAQAPAPTPESDTTQAPPLAPTPVADGPPDDRSSGIGVVADEANNTLVITATAQEYKRMSHILERIDVPPNQVLLEATIAEVRLNDDLKMGVRWFFQTGNHQLKLTDVATGAVGPAFPASPTSSARRMSRWRSMP